MEAEARAAERKQTVTARQPEEHKINFLRELLIITAATVPHHGFGNPDAH
jgi:phosphatidate phosphatase PAH1